jgi:exopolysaccharide biosynthesis glucuronosyltransferase PssE
VIFVTVGTQLPFDRLVMAVDEWASVHPGQRIVAQIGPSVLRPQHVEWRDFISPQECRALMSEARAIVAHAGMGSILTALELGKPVLIVPRRAALGEHRNEHQLATARHFADVRGVSVAFDEHELPSRLRELTHAAAQERIGRYAPDGFIAALRAFIDGRPAQAAAPSASARIPTP